MQLWAILKLLCKDFANDIFIVLPLLCDRDRAFYFFSIYNFISIIILCVYYMYSHILCVFIFVYIIFLNIC